MPSFASLPGGLKFHGSEEPISKRTSYNVFGNRTPEFSTSFTIAFDLSLYPTTEFGYLLRIKNRESNRIYNLFYDGQGGDLVFKFNEEGTHNLITANIKREELPAMQWFSMKITFDLRRDSIRLTIGDRSFTAAGGALPDTYHPVILFGKSDHIIDVPSFAIKGLSVGDKERFVFPLNQIEGNAVYNAGGSAIGKVSNPEWLMNDAYHWRHKVSLQSRSVAGANYNPERKEIYYFNRDSLFIHDVMSGETETRVFEERCPVELVLGTNFIDPARDRLYAYEVYYSFPYDGPTVASLDLNNYQWTPETSGQLPTQLHHHGSYLNQSTRQYTIFGGFGNMHYSKNFYSYDLDQEEWSAFEGFTGDLISPRYFCSVGYLKETNSIYIFGGMGNESGDQIVGRKYYYDLYKIDLDKKHISKLWEIEWNQDNMVPVRGMVILNDSTFYTLCYPEHFTQSFLRLYQFSLADGRYEVLGDSIPIYSDKITTNANLYYDRQLNNLYAVIQEFQDDISSDLKVYSLAFPPVTASELASYARNENYDTAVIILVSLSLVTGVGYFLLRKSKVKRPTPLDDTPEVFVSADKAETKMRSNAIYLFGEFTVRDKKGRDITHLFSSQLKQVLCLIIQYTTTEGGITSQRLSSLQWPDKPADKVKNSRGVTINHLRKALSELGGIALTYKKGYFRIVHTAEFYCDYMRCMEIISAPSAEEYRDELVEILARGRFLQLSDHPLFDSFKEETERKLEPVLLVEMQKSFAAELYHTTIGLAEALFNIDPLNEMALSFQIKAMHRLKLNDEARFRYHDFVTEYKRTMGNDYPHPYKV